MDQINANLDRISELSDDELKSLEGSIVSEFEAVQTQDLTPDVVESMKTLARAAVAVRNEVATREAQAAQLAMEAAEAAQAIKGIDPDNDGDVDNIVDGDTVVENDADDDADGDGNDDNAVSDGADHGTVAEAIEGIADVDNDDVAAEAAPSEDTTDTTDSAPAPAADDAQMADEAPAPSTDADPAPAAPDDETPSSDEAPAQGGTDTPEQGDLSEDDEKKVASFDSAAPAPSDEADAAPASDAPAADDASEAAAAAPADGDDTPQPAEAPAADEAAAMSENGPDATEPAPTDSADEDADEDKKNNSEDPVTASVTNELDNIDVQAPEEHAVVAAAAPEGPEYAPVTITAGADIPGIQAGAQLPDTLAVANALISRKRAMGRTMGGDGEMHHVAQFSTVFPENRVLSATDIDGNAEKIDGAVSLVAAGGISTTIAEVRYELYGLGEDVRPVKDSLAVFSADRGGIRYITPPVLTDLNGAVSLWTVTDDAAAATGSSPTKPALRVAAGAEVLVQVDAVPLILTFGNMGARAYPELVERHTKLGMIQHARFAETRILTRIGALSTQVTAAKALGAARDIFGQVETAAASYRNRHRMDAKTPLRAIFPEWFKSALRTDLIKQLPGDGMDETFGLADATINNWFNLRGINVTWTPDGETGQILGAQAAGGLNAFPTTLIWYLFSEGTFLFLDGGTLDLGIVRDSTLNATNDYKIFLETFEAVAKVGIESLRVSSQLTIAGATVGTVTPVI